MTKRELLAAIADVGIDDFVAVGRFVKAEMKVEQLFIQAVGNIAWRRPNAKMIGLIVDSQNGEIADVDLDPEWDRVKARSPKKPPIGVLPRRLWEERYPCPSTADVMLRLRDVVDAKLRSVMAGFGYPLAWDVEIRQSIELCCRPAERIADELRSLFAEMEIRQGAFHLLPEGSEMTAEEPQIVK